MQMLGHEGKALPTGLWLWMTLTRQCLAAACLHGAGAHGVLCRRELRSSAILREPLSSWIVKTQLARVFQC